MGEKVNVTLNGQKVDGWLAKPASGKGPAVVVIQEWWGLVPHVKDVTERFAKEGFVAFAPDLYHGKTTTSPDEAGRLLMELDVERAGREIAGAGAFLLQRAECASKKFGIVGFCMGGALAQYAATSNPNVGAAVSFYGGFKKCPLDWKHLASPLLLLYGGKDTGVPASDAKPLEEKLKAMDKDVEAVVYPDCGHAFFNDSRANVYDPKASVDAWKRTLALLRRALV
ncbi:MAG: dienelactone hydrolase family protein [Acidobacteria bacterium]|nr:dienelactone hydrolase family protein [Acidobacteriota bacterium]